MSVVFRSTKAGVTCFAYAGFRAVRGPDLEAPPGGGRARAAAVRLVGCIARAGTADAHRDSGLDLRLVVSGGFPSVCSGIAGHSVGRGVLSLDGPHRRP